MTEGGAQATKLIRDLVVMDWWARQRAIMHLMSYPPESYIYHLIENVRDHEDANARNAAMEVMVALGKRAVPVLGPLLGDADPEVRLFAANMLCAIREPAAVPLLVGAVGDKDINVRSACVEALGKSGSAAAVPVLREALEDDLWVAMSAVHALGEVGGPEALEVLYGCMEREELLGIAVHAIERAGTQDSIRHLTASFSIPGLRGRLLGAVMTIAEREGVRPNPEYFFGLRPMIEEMLREQDPAARRNAFIALCWSQDIGSIPAMLDAIRDEELQEYAIEGLLSIGKRALCSIVDDMKGSSGQHRVILAKVLCMMGEPMALLQFADDHDAEVRTEAALAMGGLRELERARATLRRMLSDPCGEVRDAARTALRANAGEGGEG